MRPLSSDVHVLQVMFIAFTRADNPDPEATKNALAGRWTSSVGFVFDCRSSMVVQQPLLAAGSTILCMIQACGA